MNTITSFRNKIMDLRDIRVRFQREIATLEDLQFWASWSFTEEQTQHLAQLKTKVENIKEQEQILRNKMHQEVYYA